MYNELLVNMASFEALCVKDLDEGDIFYSAGHLYMCHTKSDCRGLQVVFDKHKSLCIDMKEFLEHFQLPSLHLPFPIEFLDKVQAREIHNAVEKRYVADDVRSHALDLDVELSEGEVDYVVQRYVLDGEYDCNLSYWQNIENLIFEAVRLREEVTREV